MALMFTDLVGYSAASEKDEEGAMSLLEEHRAIMRRILPAYGGSENKTIGDAFFVEFGSVVEAVRAAMEIQATHYERNASAAKSEQIQVRIGIHLGVRVRLLVYRLITIELHCNKLATFEDGSPHLQQETIELGGRFRNRTESLRRSSA